MLNEVRFDEVEATADFTNQLRPPPAGDITQMQEDAPPAVGIPLPLAPPGVRGGMIPSPPPPQQAGAAGPGGGQQPTGDTAYSGIDSIIKTLGFTMYDPATIEAELAVQLSFLMVFGSITTADVPLTDYPGLCLGETFKM